MESLTIHELQLFEAGTNSTLTATYLTGIVKVISEDTDDYERGTVILIDQATHESIMCLVDQFHPNLDNLILFIDKWNYICCESLGICYVEFLMDNAYSSPAASTSLLRECFALDAENVFKQYPDDVYRLTENLDQPQSIAGIVEAISTLFIKPDSPAQFIISLKQPHVSILFEGNSIITYYAMFKVGLPYAFQHLNYISDKYQQPLFAFLPELSSCYSLSKSQYRKLNDSTTSSNTFVIGTITRVIDSMFGLYEINQTTLICLFHCLGYSPLRPYRVKTRIRLHRFHVVSLKVTKTKSYLLDMLASKTHILVACMQSHIDLIDIPNHCEYIETAIAFIDHHNQSTNEIKAKLKEHIYLDCISRRADFKQLISCLELYAALTIKFVQSCLITDINVLKQAYNVLKEKIFLPGYNEGNWRDHFFLHDTSCFVVGPNTYSVTNITLHVYPSLKHVLKEMVLKRLKEQDLNLVGSNTLAEADHVTVRTAIYEPNANLCWLLGQMKILQDGRTYFIDDNGSVLCLVSGSIIRSGLYLIKRFKLVQEDLSYLKNTRTTQPRCIDLKTTYIICCKQDLVYLGAGLSSLWFEIDEKYKDVAGINRYRPSRLMLEYPYWVIHVINKFPIQTIISTDAKIYLESRVIVNVYDIEDLGESCEPQTCVLILSSRDRSLHFFEELRIGDYCVIRGRYQGDEIKENGSTLHLLGDEHVIYPIFYTEKRHEEAIRLDPIFEHPSKKEEELAHDVIETVALYKTNILNERTQYQFCKQVVNVYGIVIAKRFIGGFEDPQSNRNALSLYKDFNIGTGQAHRKLYIQLRQLDTLDVIDIYLDPQHIYYPLGLLVGSTVIFHNLVCKHKTGGFFCLADQYTTVEVDTREHNDHHSPLQLSEIPIRSIISSFSDTNLFRAYCYLSHVIHINMKWQCCRCGTVIQRGDCNRYCDGSPGRNFIANALVEVDDGLGTASVNVDGERLLFRLLFVSEQQVTAIKQAVLEYGEITYDAWRQNKELKGDQESAHTIRFKIQDIIKRALKAGHFWLYARVQPSSRQKRKITFEEEDEEIDIFDKKLKAVEVQLPDPRLVSYNYLKELDV
ncbi:CST, telomere maintenance, complex subunit CTC1-domain-containing protein [Cokeromyces recurvatus]|uniref:CST, telomere maintenance, complex subunit CTC1-domain-containing protein n=1 Tax=Cokeromyces recurvatus TaxID=90255 RepID=UPI00221FF1E4|nr:CST, telomere maintenance, complex subunit CTC1-domain-containing protein [Cokeromyces recurvatus]KAI7903888.1 CST, telomere maintenance, complex subunit CTC1-domain-containing protein [Cokeromyces recurvatus]